MLETIMWLLTYGAYALFVWTIGFALHELFHYWEGKRQGANVQIKVWFWHSFPSLITTFDSLRWPFSFYLMGGLGAGLILCAVSTVIPFIVWQWFSFWQYWVWCVGVINLIYSVYEAVYIDILPRDIYMKWHYILYFIVGIIFSILYWGYASYVKIIGV